MFADAGAHLGRNILESSIAKIFVDEAGVLESLTCVVAFNLWIYVSVHLKEILPAIVVVVEESAAPGYVLVVDADSGGKRNVVEGAVSVVVVEIASVVGEICFENVEPAVAVVICNAHAHPGLLMAIFAVRAASDHRDVRERAVVIVVEKNAGLRIDGDINIRPAIVIEIIGNGRNRIARAWLHDARLYGDVRESSIAVVVIEQIGVPGKATRTAHGGNAFPLANGRLGRRWSYFRIEFDVVAY